MHPPKELWAGGAPLTQVAAALAHSGIRGLQCLGFGVVSKDLGFRF